MVRTPTARGQSSPQILTLLELDEHLDPQLLARVRKVQETANAQLERALINDGVLTEAEIARIFAERLGLTAIRAEVAPPADSALAMLIPEKVCTTHLLVPWANRGDVIEVAFASPDGLASIDVLQWITGRLIRPLVAPLSVIDSRIEALYRTSLEIGGEFAGEETVQEEADENVLDLDASPPADESGRVIRMVNQILEQALRTGASDIHLEPFESSCKFRLRIDGVLHELPAPTKSAFLMILSRFKILGKMDIAEKRLPQDGAIAVKSSDRRIDLRVNTVPTVHGEKMVMRLLDKAAIPVNLVKLGLDEQQKNDLVEAIHMPHGLALVTGPTGSGKSTTLYACLNLMNNPDINICTVEDPVEYKFKGLNQVHVRSQIGLTFASALRAFLRQDPDIIMVGEIRDQETAEICLRAALTGHFVLSTLHTNDALSAVSRLVDMGIEPFLLASTLRLLEAQRLVRQLCESCKEPYELDAATAERYGLDPHDTIYRPKGCLRCRRSGYKGRVGVFEIIRISPRLAELIQANAAVSELRKVAREEGMKLLFDCAMDKVRQGRTSLEAALSVAMGD